MNELRIGKWVALGSLLIMLKVLPETMETWLRWLISIIVTAIVTAIFHFAIVGF